MRPFTRNQAIAAKALAEDTPVNPLEVHMLAAIAKGDAALAAYRSTRNVQYLIDGLLDVRNRLTKGMDL